MILAHVHWFWDTGGRWYIFWSGFGSCLTEFAILGVVWRKVNCHQKGCWRIGLHHVVTKGGRPTSYIVCRKHHPTVPTRGARAEHIVEAHDQEAAP